jgi:hypothetical protein
LRVLLVDVDSTIPNLALMKLSAWHRAQGNEVGFKVSHPDKVYGSCVFSWNAQKARAYREMELGGTGIDLTVKLPEEVEAMPPDYSLYGERFPNWQGVGLGFLQRGCIRNCQFCLVPKKEGKPKVVAKIDDLLNPDWQKHWKRPFIVLLDNNFLANREWALATLEEIAWKDYHVSFSQGLDIRLVDKEISAALAAVKFWNLKHSGQQLTFAFDHVGVEQAVRNGISLLGEAGIKPYRLQFFVLCGFNSTFEEDLYRVHTLRSLGVDPFAMVYRNPVTGARDKKLKHFARWVNKRLYKVCDWEHYSRWEQMRDQGELFTSEVE